MSTEGGKRIRITRYTGMEFKPLEKGIVECAVEKGLAVSQMGSSSISQDCRFIGIESRALRFPFDQVSAPNQRLHSG